MLKNGMPKPRPFFDRREVTFSSSVVTGGHTEGYGSLKVGSLCVGSNHNNGPSDGSEAASNLILKLGSDGNDNPINVVVWLDKEQVFKLIDALMDSLDFRDEFIKEVGDG